MEAVTGDTYRIIYTVNGEAYYSVTATAVTSGETTTITYPAPADPTNISGYNFSSWNYGGETVSVSSENAIITVGTAPTDIPTPSPPI